jgi:hypothetical protein
MGVFFMFSLFEQRDVLTGTPEVKRTIKLEARLHMSLSVASR